MSLVDIDRGKHGAKRASFQKEGYREIGLKIIMANPDADVEDIVDEFHNALMKNRGAQRAGEIYILANLKASVVKPYRPRLDVETGRAPPTMSERVEHKATVAVKHALMDFEMPNGKTLGQSTGAECRKAGIEYGQKGKWLIAISDKIGPRGVVAKELTEADIKKMAAKAKR